MFTILADYITYWVIGLSYAVLDLTRPKWAEPFKVQNNFHLTKEEFVKAAAMGLKNQAIVLAFTYVVCLSP